VKNGVPYDVAFTLPMERVEAFGIILGEFEGGKFDFGTWSWRDPK
jgi:hypothetical protein